MVHKQDENVGSKLESRFLAPRETSFTFKFHKVKIQTLKAQEREARVSK